MFCKKSKCFDRPDYWISTICPAKSEKNRIMSEVCKFTKNTASLVLFTSDAMYKKYKWLPYTSSDLLARFCKVNLSNTKNSVWFFILASLLDKGMQPINYKCVNWLIYGDREPFIALDSSKIIAIFWVSIWGY